MTKGIKKDKKELKHRKSGRHYRNPKKKQRNGKLTENTREATRGLIEQFQHETENGSKEHRTTRETYTNKEKDKGLANQSSGA